MCALFLGICKRNLCVCVHSHVCRCVFVSRSLRGKSGGVPEEGMKGITSLLQ